MLSIPALALLLGLALTFLNQARYFNRGLFQFFYDGRDAAREIAIFCFTPLLTPFCTPIGRVRLKA